MPPTFFLHDYVSQAWNPAALVSTMDEWRTIDRTRAAERRSDFLRSAQELISGLPKMVADIQQHGILEENLTALRKTLTEEIFRQQSSIDWAEAELRGSQIRLQELRKTQAQAPRHTRVKWQDLIRDQEFIIDDLETIREATLLVRDAYAVSLEALSSVAPKRLSAEDYATVRAIDDVLPKFKKMQDELQKNLGLDRGKETSPGIIAESVGSIFGATLIFGTLLPGVPGIALGVLVGLAVAFARHKQIAPATAHLASRAERVAQWHSGESLDDPDPVSTLQKYLANKPDALIRKYLDNLPSAQLQWYLENSPEAQFRKYLLRLLRKPWV